MTEEILLEEFEDTGKPTEKRPEPKSYNFKEIDREELQTKLKDIVTISPLPTSDAYFLKASHYVGSAPLPSGEFIINIKPKIEYANFFQMLMKCEIFPPTPFENIKALTGTTLADFLAQIFIKYTNKILATGLYKTYTTIEEEIPAIKGRLLLVKNIRSVLNAKLKPWCEYDELSFDVIENRCILYCADLLIRDVIGKQTKQDLVTIRTQFLNQNVILTPINYYELETIHIQKFNKNYEDVLKFCKYILQRKYYQKFSKSGTIGIPGFFQNMNDLFEKFVYVTLKESLGSEFNVLFQDKNPHIIEQIEDYPKQKKLRETPRKIKPDIVLQKNGKDYLVLDTKYKRKPSDSDFYQATVYSLAKKCDTILFLPEDKREINDGYKIKKEFTGEDDLTIHIKTIKFEDEEDFIQKMETKILNAVNSVKPITSIK